MSLPEPTDLLPHRRPFLFVDQLLELEPGKSAIGRWTVDPEEPFLRGHFPGHPIVPGVLIIEALAQVGACLAAVDPRYAGRIPALARLENARFRRQVKPGDTLELRIELGHTSASAGKGRAVATVDGETAAEVDLTFVVFPRPETVPVIP